MVIKYLVIKYSNRTTRCTLLSLKDDMAFWNLLKSTNLHDLKSLKLLFKASDHDYSSFKFHRECDNEGANITIIQTNHGHIYGGYTSKSWTSFADMVMPQYKSAAHRYFQNRKSNVGMIQMFIIHYFVERYLVKSMLEFQQVSRVKI